MALPREHDARVLVFERDGDVRVRLVVAQPDVERRPVALDEVLLEVERLALGLGDDHLHVLDAGDEIRDSEPGVAPAEVGADPRPQRLRLPDVEHAAAGAPKEVHAGPLGQVSERPFEPLLAGVGDDGHTAA
jgi:hypothetical protein